MKKLNLKFLMVRPSDGFLPLALLIVALLGWSEEADGLFMALLFSRLFALATAPGLRQAFARQPSMRMARLMSAGVFPNCATACPCSCKVRFCFRRSSMLSRSRL